MIQNNRLARKKQKNRQNTFSDHCINFYWTSTKAQAYNCESDYIGLLLSKHEAHT